MLLAESRLYDRHASALHRSYRRVASKIESIGVGLVRQLPKPTCIAHATPASIRRRASLRPRSVRRRASTGMASARRTRVIRSWSKGGRYLLGTLCPAGQSLPAIIRLSIGWSPLQGADGRGTRVVAQQMHSSNRVEQWLSAKCATGAMVLHVLSSVRPLRPAWLNGVGPTSHLNFFPVLAEGS